MRVRQSLWLGLALGVLLWPGAEARAVLVQYVTTGTFSGGDLAGTNTYLDAAHGISIVFNSSLNNSVDVPPGSQTSFGQFDTSATTATTFATVSSGFTLDIFQTAPTAGMLTFVGTLSGKLKINNSQAFIQFSGPLTQQIGQIFYSIVSADNNTPGRVNIAPPTTNGGLTTVVGFVNAVPEPSSILLAALGGPVLLGVAYRHRKKAGAPA